MVGIHNKQISLSLKERIKKLESLIQDAIDSKFNGELIKNYRKQLKEQEEILKKDMEKRKEIING